MESLAVIILTLVEKAIIMEPRIEAALRKILAKPQPTPEDWQAERAEIANPSYHDLVPHSQLPPSGA